LKKRKGSLPLPKELRERHGAAVQISNLLPLPDKLRDFLSKDIQAIRAKHLTGTTGDDLLAASTFLDIRFQQHDLWKSYLSKDTVQKSVAHMAFEASSQYPNLIARLQKQSDDPMNWSLAALGESAAGKAKARGRAARGRGRGRGAGRAASAKSEPRTAAEVVLQTAAAPTGQRVQRRLHEQTSAEGWLFGSAPKDGGETEQAVLDDVQSVSRNDNC